MTTKPNQNTGVSRLIPGYKYNTTTKNYLHSFNHLKATKTLHQLATTLMMIHGGGTTPPTLTSLHGWVTTKATVADPSSFAVLFVAIDYYFSRPLLRFQASDFCCARCLRVFALYWSKALYAQCFYTIACCNSACCMFAV